MLQRIVRLSELPAFVADLLAYYPNGVVCGLTGPLGAGKTELVRHVLAALAARSGTAPPRATSPTFTLHNRYPGPPCVDHFDLYRLDHADARALAEMGYTDAVTENRAAGGYVFVEWPERADARALGLQARLVIEVLTEGARRFTLSAE